MFELFSTFVSLVNVLLFWEGSEYEHRFASWEEVVALIIPIVAGFCESPVPAVRWGEAPASLAYDRSA